MASLQGKILVHYAPRNSEMLVHSKVGFASVNDRKSPHQSPAFQLRAQYGPTISTRGRVTQASECSVQRPLVRD